MSKKAIEEIIAETLEVGAEKVNGNSTRADLAEWDSLGHIHLMVALEEEYNITIKATAFSEVKSVEELKVFIEKLK